MADICTSAFLQPAPRVGVAIGEYVLDLSQLDCFSGPEMSRQAHFFSQVALLTSTALHVPISSQLTASCMAERKGFGKCFMKWSCNFLHISM